MECCRRRAWARSKAVWRRSHWSAVDQPAFSSRIAISGEMAARPFSTRDRVWRATPRMFAVSEIERPSGSRQASLIEWPGCGGFFIGIVGLLAWQLVVIEEINIDRIAIFKAKGNTPISGDSDAPMIRQIPFQFMKPVARQVKVLQGNSTIQIGQHIAKAIELLGTNSSWIILFKKTLQAFVPECLEHKRSVSCTDTDIKVLATPAYSSYGGCSCRGWLYRAGCR